MIFKDFIKIIFHHTQKNDEQFNKKIEKKKKIFMVINCCEIICKKRPAKANIKKKLFR